VTMMNYDMGREVFVNLGEMINKCIHDLKDGWSEFLNYYTGLNEERKRDEQKFLEERGILEEHED
jgi:hypothetical protein